MASQNVEEYIEAIYRLGGSGGTVSTCDLADMLGVAPPSVTTMIRRMSRDGLVVHVRYHGISLTPQGLEMAIAVIRRHRLAERLLTDVLGVPMERVHDAACKLEHALTGEVEECAYRVLGEPDRCPHGQPLDGAEEQSLVRLSDVAAGERVGVVKLTEESEKFLSMVRDLGIIPSAECLVESLEDGLMHVRVNGNTIRVAIEAAGEIWVSKMSPAGLVSP